MSTTTTESYLSKPLVSRWARPFAMARAAEEYERLAEALRGLEPQDWAAPTCCAGWDVRAMAGHCLGMATMMTTVRETMRQQRLAGREAKRDGVALVDALTAIQVRENAHLTPRELVERMADVGPRAVRGRRRVRGPMRWMTIPDEGDGTAAETWRMGFLVDTILTRDPWMHRTDIAVATGRPLHLTPGHDGAIVADVVAEWAARHGRPYHLVLTGPAGGEWDRAGDGVEQIEADAVEFCRGVSGRTGASGLAGTWVPF
ncbi:MAG: maleylpyruvate isomerase family mycothiol-dependent enzyme [Nocardioides sp.]|nr:maleylpyruvate isomerase family mycothiol-dependent enzyme [Nocardioides sp.]